MTFGLTDGWWCFEDNALRPDYPLLSKDSWQAVLKSKFGSKGLYSGEHDVLQSLFIAKKVVTKNSKYVF